MEDSFVVKDKVFPKEILKHLMPRTLLVNGLYQGDLEHIRHKYTYGLKNALLILRSDGYVSSVYEYKISWLPEEHKIKSGLMTSFDRTMSITLFARYNLKEHIQGLTYGNPTDNFKSDYEFTYLRFNKFRSTSDISIIDSITKVDYGRTAIINIYNNFMKNGIVRKVSDLTQSATILKDQDFLEVFVDLLPVNCNYHALVETEPFCTDKVDCESLMPIHLGKDDTGKYFYGIKVLKLEDYIRDVNPDFVLK